MKDANGNLLTVLDAIPTRCTIVMDEQLTGFHLSNAIAVIAMTAGRRHPALLGGDLIDRDGTAHPGLIPSGIPMLQASQETLHRIRQQAVAKGLDVVDFTEEGQATKNYEEYVDMMSQIPEAELRYLGVALIGSKSAVSRLTKECEMMK